MTTLDTCTSFVDGTRLPPADGDAAGYTNRDPATDEELCRVETADAALVDRAVAGASAAFESWAARPGAERGRILIETARRLRARTDELARLEVLDTGKPIQEATAVDIASAADCLEFFGGLAATALTGEHHTLGANFAYTRREPLGVVAGLGAWNYPLQIAAWKAAPALAAGNCMVFKPSELTPLTAGRLAETFVEAGLPPGVFQTVLGDGPTGAALTTHAVVRKVSLTGSVATGRAVYRSCADDLKPVTLELGGKSPLLIFEDADLDEAVSAAMLANFYTQGEVCSNGTRVYVHRALREAFLERLLARTAKLRLGDPLDPATQVGALISAEHWQKVRDHVEAGQQAGATLLCGGDRPAALRGTRWGAGHFFEPTVFTDCREGMRLVREEIFGPVMAVLDFDNEDEVVARANSTEYGLAAGVFTRDLARAHRVVAELQAGTCWINTYNITPVEIPFGGMKHSGLGRENSRHALDGYTQLKTVYVETGRIDCPYE